MKKKQSRKAFLSSHSLYSTPTQKLSSLLGAAQCSEPFSCSWNNYHISFSPPALILFVRLTFTPDLICCRCAVLTYGRDWGWWVPYTSLARCLTLCCWKSRKNGTQQLDENALGRLINCVWQNIFAEGFCLSQPCEITKRLRTWNSIDLFLTLSGEHNFLSLIFLLSVSTAGWKKKSSEQVSGSGQAWSNPKRSEVN